MSQQKLISIIIVNYNGEKYIRTLMESIRSQTYPNYEIIFVDNGSTDDSLRILQNTENIIIIQSTNIGYSSGINLGIRESKGKYILVLNNDTNFEKTFISSLYDEMIDKQLDVIAPRENKYYGQGGTKYTSKIDLFGHQIFIADNNSSSGLSFYLSGVCLLCSKDTYISTGGMDNDFFLYFEGTDWFWRLILFKKRFSYSNTTYINHDGTNRDIIPNTKTSLYRNQNTLQMLLKNYSIYSLILVIPIYFLINLIEIFFFLLLLKPKLSYTYIQGWWFNLKNLRNILKKRKVIQQKRKVPDYIVFSRMYFGSAKLVHLYLFVKSKYEKNIRDR